MMKNKIVWILITVLLVGGMVAAVIMYDNFAKVSDTPNGFEKITNDDFWKEIGGEPDGALVVKPPSKPENDIFDNITEAPEDNGGATTPEAPEDNGGATTPEAPEKNGGATTPEAPEDNGGATTPEAPEDNGGATTPEAPEENGGATTPEAPEENGGATTPEAPEGNGGATTPEAPESNDENNTSEIPETVDPPVDQEEVIVMNIPNFTVIDYNGNEVQLSDYIGKPIVLNFWATWCYYCKAEMADFNKAYHNYPDVQFLMVNATDGYNETVSSAKNYVEKQGYSFSVFFDTKGEAINAYHVSGFPTTYFINANGDLEARAVGMLDYETLVEGIGMITE